MSKWLKRRSSKKQKQQNKQQQKKKQQQPWKKEWFLTSKEVVLELSLCGDVSVRTEKLRKWSSFSHRFGHRSELPFIFEFLRCAHVLHDIFYFWHTASGCSWRLDFMPILTCWMNVFKFKIRQTCISKVIVFCVTPYRSWEFHNHIKYQCPGVTVPNGRRFWRALICFSGHVDISQEIMNRREHQKLWAQNNKTLSNQLIVAIGRRFFKCIVDWSFHWLGLPHISFQVWLHHLSFRAIDDIQKKNRFTCFEGGGFHTTSQHTRHNGEKGHFSKSPRGCRVLQRKSAVKRSAKRWRVECGVSAAGNGSMNFFGQHTWHRNGWKWYILPANLNGDMLQITNSSLFSSERFPKSINKF